MSQTFQLALIGESTLISVALLVYIVTRVRRLSAEKKQDRLRLERAEQTLTEALRAAQPLFLTATAKLDALVDLHAGMEAMCREFARSVDLLERTMKLLSGMMSGTREPGEEPNVFEAEQRAEDRMEVESLVRRGIPEEEANDRVTEKRLYQRMGQRQ